MEIMRKMNKDRSKLMYIIRICLIFVFFLTFNFSCSFTNNFKNSKKPVIEQSNSSYLYANPSRNAVYDACLPSDQLKVKWKFRISLGVDPRETYKSIDAFPIAYNNLVYIEDYTHDATCALDIETGEVVWKKDVEFEPITIYDGIIYVLQDGPKKALTGENLWILNAATRWTEHSPIVFKNVLYINYNDCVFALNAKTGEVIWKHKDDNSRLSTPFILIDSEKIGCSIEGRGIPPNLLILDTKTGKEVKRYNSVYFHGYSEENFYLERVDKEKNAGFLIALNRRNDRERWRFEIKEQSNLYIPSSMPRVQAYVISKNNKLYFSALNGSVYCLNSKTGELIWETKFERSKILPNDIPFPGNSPSFCDDKLYVVMDECLYTLDAESGKILNRFSTGGRIWSNPFIYKNKIFITSDDGLLYCLE